MSVLPKTHIAIPTRYFYEIAKTNRPNSKIVICIKNNRKKEIAQLPRGSCALYNSSRSFRLHNVFFQHKGDIEAAVVFKVNDHFVLRGLIQAAASIFLVKICT